MSWWNMNIFDTFWNHQWTIQEYVDNTKTIWKSSRSMALLWLPDLEIVGPHPHPIQDQHIRHQPWWIPPLKPWAGGKKRASGSGGNLWKFYGLLMTCSDIDGLSHGNNWCFSETSLQQTGFLFRSESENLAQTNKHVQSKHCQILSFWTPLWMAKFPQATENYQTRLKGKFTRRPHFCRVTLYGSDISPEIPMQSQPLITTSWSVESPALGQLAPCSLFFLVINLPNFHRYVSLLYELLPQVSIIHCSNPLFSGEIPSKSHRNP